MDNRIIFLDGGSKKVADDCDQISERSVVAISYENIPPQEAGRYCCPDCRIRMVRLGNCFSCPLCGYGGCG
ncbi:MAG: hypothetical protein DRP51_08505 [Candidatus Zixiibacteriota bacterium]|nr:MAG: hypothetical protein DRP51_08505 [candidate division Zixibacteria bacterium]HHI03183.1 hypothetical protein [candidate division Zixibacteria bacterium]